MTQPHICFLSLDAALPLHRSGRPDPALLTASAPELQRVMDALPDVRFVITGEKRKADLESTHAFLRHLGYPSAIIDRIADQTPRITVMVNGEPHKHLPATGVEIELYLEHTMKRILSSSPHGYTIVTEHDLYFKYMEDSTIEMKDGTGLTKELADRLIKMMTYKGSFGFAHKPKEDTSR